MKQTWSMLERGRQNYVDFLNISEIMALRTTFAENREFAYFIAGEWMKKLLAEEDSAVLEKMEVQREAYRKALLEDKFAVLTHMRRVDTEKVTALERDILLDVIPLFENEAYVAELKERLEAISEEELVAREV